MKKRIITHFLLSLPGLTFMLFYLPIWPSLNGIYTLRSFSSAIIFFLFMLLFVSNITAGIMFARKKFNKISVYTSRIGIVLFILLILIFITNLLTIISILNGISPLPKTNH